MKFDCIEYHEPIQSFYETKKVNWSKAKVTDLFSETITYVLRVDPFSNCLVKITGLLCSMHFLNYSGTSNSGHFWGRSLVAVALEMTVVGRF